MNSFLRLRNCISHPRGATCVLLAFPPPASKDAAKKAVKKAAKAAKNKLMSKMKDAFGGTSDPSP